MKNTLIIHTNTLLFLYVFILPHTIYTIIDIEYSLFFLITLLPLLFIIILRLGFQKYNREAIFFSLAMIILGVIVMLYKGGVNQNAVLFVPIFTYFGFLYVRRFSMDLRWFNLVFVVLYAYFYIIYYSKLPDLFYRPGFDEDAIVFERASSNGISVALNITLYSYVILNYFFNQNRHKELLFIALINVILVFIQQSRAGILCAMLLLFIIIYHNFRSWFKKAVFMSLILFLVVAINKNSLVFLSYFSNNNIESFTYTEDNRSQSAITFLKRVWNEDFIWGVPIGSKFDVGEYTFNVFLDFWNNYSFIGFLILLLIIINRYFKKNEYYFPIYLFFPFLLYSMVESYFFPGYWDVIIYMLLFIKKYDVKLVMLGS